MFHTLPHLCRYCWPPGLESDPEAFYSAGSSSSSVHLQCLHPLQDPCICCLHIPLQRQRFRVRIDITLTTSI